MFEVYQIGFEDSETENAFFDEQAAISFIISALPSDDFWYCVTNDGGNYTAVVHQGAVWRSSLNAMLSDTLNNCS